MSHLSRIIVLVDMDCFYCQVEEKLNPKLEGKPIAVVQYNAWRGGGIIAVNYPARARGVTRHMRGNEAKEKCPDIILARVPEVRGKADLTKYREAGNRVAEVLQQFTTLLERASVDEAYLDITEAVEKRIESCSYNDFDEIENTYVVGCDFKDFIQTAFINKEFSESNFKLAIGALIAHAIRTAVFERTGYKCSAGIAHNKILAKLVCGLNKPNKQTILPQDAVAELYQDLPIKKIKSLGGKFGNNLAEELQISNMGELSQFSEKQLARKFDEKTARWLYNIARGIDLEPVTLRLISKSIGCCKKFPGRTALTLPEDVEHWLNELSCEISERLLKDLEQNNRKAKQIIISFAQCLKGKNVSSSRTQPLNSYEQTKIAQVALEVIKKNCLKSDDSYHITFLGISVGNFQDLKKNAINITNFFKNLDASEKNASKIDRMDVTEKNFFGNIIVAEKKLPDKIKCNEIFKEEQLDSTSEEDITEHSSVYSASTEELTDDDTKNLIYYEDIFSQSVSSQPITNYIKTTENTQLIHDDIRKSSSYSFFEKYFEDNQNIADDHTIEPANPPISCIEELSITNPSPRNTEIENTEEICPECNKKVASSDFISHTDYHFALKMVKDESHIYKVEKRPIRDSNNTKDNRKKKQFPSNNQQIVSFFKNVDLDESNSQLCALCNKRIKLEEIASHADYHTAKKLWEEEKFANDHSVKRKRNEIKNTPCKLSGIKPIIEFLKQSDASDSNSEFCSECNKKIKLNEFDSHIDYHTAKKIQDQINSDCCQNENNQIMTKVKNINKKSKDLTSFFKHK